MRASDSYCTFRYYEQWRTKKTQSYPNHNEPVCWIDYVQRYTAARYQTTAGSVNGSLLRAVILGARRQHCVIVVQSSTTGVCPGPATSHYSDHRGRAADCDRKCR